MIGIKYVKLNEVNPNQFLSILNNQKNRAHLIEHELFNEKTMQAWINSKIKVDSAIGCKLRAVIYKDQLAGWCGIQLEDGKYEIAIVIDHTYWGLGKNIFIDIMSWAKELGHKEILIHFLHTRPEYKFLHKLASHVYETKLLENKFTTYQIPVL